METTQFDYVITYNVIKQQQKYKSESLSTFNMSMDSLQSYLTK